jgi:hypothetical protein
VGFVVPFWWRPQYLFGLVMFSDLESGAGPVTRGSVCFEAITRTDAQVGVLRVRHFHVQASNHGDITDRIIGMVYGVLYWKGECILEDIV